MGNYKLMNLSFICLRLIWLLLLTYVYSVGLIPCPKISSLYVFIFEILTKAVDLCCIKMSDKAAQQMTILPTVTSVWCTHTETLLPTHELLQPNFESTETRFHIDLSLSSTEWWVQCLIFQISISGMKINSVGLSVYSPLLFYLSKFLNFLTFSTILIICSCDFSNRWQKL